MEKAPRFEEQENQENLIKEALGSAELYEVEAPRPGSKAYDAVMEMAQKYVATLRMFDQLSNPKDKESARSNLNTLDHQREMIHDQLCLKLEGKHKNELDTEERQRVANFAAYLVGAEEYVVRGGKFQSQTSYFHQFGKED